MPNPEGRRYRYLVTTSYIFFILSLICLVIGILYSDKYDYFGLESIYTLSAIFLMLGIILFTNTRMDTADKKAIVSDPVLFKTGAPFNIAATGIVANIGTLYHFFWQ